MPPPVPVSPDGVDLYGFTPEQQTKPVKKHWTKCGLFMSLLVIAFVLWYMVTTFERFFNGNTIVEQTTAKSVVPGQPEASVPPFSLSQEHISNRSFFTFYIEHRAIPFPGAHWTSWNRTIIPMTVTESVHGRETYAPANLSLIPPLYGDCTSGPCGYVRVRMWICEKVDQDPPCAPLSDIEDVINHHYLRFYIYVTEEGVQHEHMTQISMKTSFSFKRQFYFNNYETEIHPDYWKVWSEEKFSEIQLAHDLSSIDRLPRPTGSTMGKIDILLTGRTVTKQYIPQTLYDLLGQWDAFYGFIFGVTAFIMLRYNKRRFYKKHKEWTEEEEDAEKGDEKEKEDECPNCKQKKTTKSFPLQVVFDTNSANGASNEEGNEMNALPNAVFNENLNGEHTNTSQPLLLRDEDVI